MYCPNCGAKNSDDAKFCFACGNPLPAQNTEGPVKVSFAEDVTIPPRPEEPIPVKRKGRGLMAVGRIGVILSALLMIIAVFVPTFTASNIDAAMYESLGFVTKSTTLANFFTHGMRVGILMIPFAAVAAAFAVFRVYLGACIFGFISAVWGMLLGMQTSELLKQANKLLSIQVGVAHDLIVAGASWMLIFAVLGVLGRMRERGKR